MSINLDELRTFISSMYSDVALLPRGDFHFATGRPILEKLGYPVEMLDQIPTSSVESFAGVGYHFDLEPLKPGERVLDVGSGAGTDACYAAISVGDTGKVVGIDMTEAMLEKANKSVEALGSSALSFVRGHIEDPPFGDGEFDVVTSNGVINLSPRKDRVFAEVHRMLAPGGRLMFSDIVTGVELPESVRDNCELWAECIGGAVEKERYLRLIERAGLKIEQTRPNSYEFIQDSTIQAAKKFEVSSISVLARRV